MGPEFLVTSPVVILPPGAGVPYALAADAGRGGRAPVLRWLRRGLAVALGLPGLRRALAER